MQDKTVSQSPLHQIYLYCFINTPKILELPVELIKTELRIPRNNFVCLDLPPKNASGI